MADGLKSALQISAHLLRWRIRRDQLRMRRFEVGQLLHELVEFEIRNNWARFLVVIPVMNPELLAELGDTLGGSRHFWRKADAILSEPATPAVSIAPRPLGRRAMPLA